MIIYCFYTHMHMVVCNSLVDVTETFQRLLVNTSTGPICVQCLDSFGRRSSTTEYFESFMISDKEVVGGALVIPDPEISIPGGRVGFDFDCQPTGSGVKPYLNILLFSNGEYETINQKWIMVKVVISICTLITYTPRMHVLNDRVCFSVPLCP